MKNIIFITVIALSLAMFGCDDSKKKKIFPMWPMGSNVKTTTVTEPGDTSGGTTDTGGDTTGGSTDTGGGSQTDTGSGGTPSDVNQDTGTDGGFQYATIINVTFDLTIVDASEQAVSQASITVEADKENISSSVSDNAGKAAFKSTINQTCKSIELVIEHPDYVTKTVAIDNIQDLAVVSRVIHLEKKNQAPAVIDTDKDGVSDDTDQYPDDPALIASVSKEFTIAYEDLYPSQGDADFNDLVVKIALTEYINPQNRISKINVRCKALSAGAGYTNQFWISILGKDYQLITDPKVDTMGSWNDKPDEDYVDATVHSLDIIYENPVARTDIAPMPYDPYIKANGSEKNQVHLPFVTTSFTGDRLDSTKFPWAVLVPDEWMWPYESTKIFKAYPHFEEWYKSDGKLYQDWYLNPDKDYTFPVPEISSLMTFMMKGKPIAGMSILGGVIGVIITAVVAINIRRRKIHNNTVE